VVGHLREVKSAADRVRGRGPAAAGHADIRIDHIGDADATGLAQARAAQRANPSYRWLGAAAAQRGLGASSAPTCWCTPARWKAAPT
jgi:hypothetical protein